jgi:hypothetical protein
MSSPTINIVTQQSHDKTANVIAVVAIVVTLLAQLIPAAATILAAVITARHKVLACCCIPKDDWQEHARRKGWIPRDECKWKAIDVEGQDDDGQKATVRIHMLAGEYRWVLGSSSQIELGNESADLSGHIRNLEISPIATTVVAVGMASVEGTYPKQSVLSQERADRIIRVVKDELKPSIPVHGLSLGRFIDERSKSTPRETSTQRRVVVVEVLGFSRANLSKAVYDALRKAAEGPDPLPFNVTDYKDQTYTDHSFGKL